MVVILGNAFYFALQGININNSSAFFCFRCFLLLIFFLYLLLLALLKKQTIYNSIFGSIWCRCDLRYVLPKQACPAVHGANKRMMLSYSPYPTLLTLRQSSLPTFRCHLDRLASFLVWLLLLPSLSSLFTFVIF